MNLFIKNKIKKLPRTVKNKILECYDVFYTSKKTGRTHSVRIPKYLPIFFLFLTCGTWATLAVVLTILISVRKSNATLEQANYSRMGIQGEVDALNKKIKAVQQTIDQVEFLSEKIKKVTTRNDDRKDGMNYKSRKQSFNFDQTGIGPLTKEEYELIRLPLSPCTRHEERRVHYRGSGTRATSNDLQGLNGNSIIMEKGGIKENKLQLKTMFELVESSNMEASKQLEDLKRFLFEAQKHAKKLEFIPDLAPIHGRLSSLFGWRTSPINGIGRMHFGIDIAAPIGSPIYATASGEVILIANTEDYGKMVEIQHDNKMLTKYAHTSAVYVKKGQRVHKGDIIAAVGNTGRSTGPHVHYEIEVNGKRMDPENYIVLW